MAQTEETAPSREDWQEWQGHPVTRWFRQELARVQSQAQKDLASGTTLRARSDDTAQTTAYLIGYVKGIASVSGVAADEIA